jgi:Fe-S cluster assembly protein SufD
MDTYLKAFEAVKKSAGAEPPWLKGLREEAANAFSQKGFPNLKDDAWRFTDVAAIQETVFSLDEADAALDPETLRSLKKPADANFVLVVNGRFSKENSTIEAGVEVMDLVDAIAARPELLEAHLGRYAVPGGDGFLALNAGLFTRGIFVHISDGVSMKDPLHVVYYGQASHREAAFQIRNLIVAGKKSKASLAETYLGGAGKKYLTNAVTEIVLEEDARMEHCKIQREHSEAFHVAVTHIALHRGSSFASLAVSTGARLMRDDRRVALAGENASCELGGVYLADQDQVLDHQTFVDHQKPDGKSGQFFKGILSGNSRGVFRGYVRVCQDAQRTDARQTNKNLLLSEGAKVDTQPQLEILADDVQCSHGAAVGQLQEDALFYLRSRGIGEREAGRILAQGFAREVIESSSVGFMKEALLELVNEKLAQQLSGEKD